MREHFVSATHKERFINMMIEDGMVLSDVERASLFYIISGNEDLYRKRKYIYNFHEHSIYICLDNTKVDFSSSMKSLIRLGFNLFNGWSDKDTTPISLFRNLDYHNLQLAENAIITRFNPSFLNGLIE